MVTCIADFKLCCGMLLEIQLSTKNTQSTTNTHLIKPACLI